MKGKSNSCHKNSKGNRHNKIQSRSSENETMTCYYARSKVTEGQESDSANYGDGYDSGEMFVILAMTVERC